MVVSGSRRLTDSQTMKTDSAQPVITVVIPAWNLGAEFQDCVRSIREQEEPARLVVVDNASDRPLPRIKDATELRLTKRVTIGEARNEGLRVVRTPYVFFMDADDLMLPG